MIQILIPGAQLETQSQLVGVRRGGRTFSPNQISTGLEKRCLVLDLAISADSPWTIARLVSPRRCDRRKGRGLDVAGWRQDVAGSSEAGGRGLARLRLLEM